MKIFILTILLQGQAVYAIDFSAYKDKLKGQVESLLGEDIASKLFSDSKKSHQALQMPKIPDFELSATDDSVYDKKSSSVHSQGDEFNKLNKEDKRSFYVSFIRELFLVTRLNEIEKNELLKFLNVLEQGGDREGVYRSLVLDNEYKSLELYEQSVANELIDFINSYSLKFLNKSFSEDAMRRLNLFSIKRIITEKTLELIDVLAMNPEDLYAWYAIFSSDMASDHVIWKNKLRADTNQMRHYAWVQKVPFQHIKSEVIIKLHMIMNSLSPIQK